uniref:Uncharacterized protein n=1 Tax=Cacopsylla melanoneura TaxID=428564 RepID=A0A8D8UQI6_9HEMI
MQRFTLKSPCPNTGHLRSELKYLKWKRKSKRRKEKHTLIQPRQRRPRKRETSCLRMESMLMLLRSILKLSKEILMTPSIIVTVLPATPNLQPLIWDSRIVKHVSNWIRNS